MRLTGILSATNPTYGFNKSMKNFRNPQDPKKYFGRAVLPLKLRNTVTCRGSSESDVVCIQEMMSLFSCLESNDFNQKLCVNEKDVLQSCYKAYLGRKRTLRNSPDPTEPIPGSKKFSKAQLNNLLSRYPQL